MIKVTLALFCLLVASLASVFANAQTNTSTTTTTTTATATTTTTTTGLDTVTVTWTSPIYPGNNYSANIVLSKAVPNGKNLTIKFWNSDNNFKISDLFLDNTSGTYAWVNYWCTGAPMNSMFFFDLSLTGSAASSFQFASGSNYANITYLPKKNLTISEIPRSMYLGTSYTIYANISAPLSQYGYIMINPSFDSNYFSFLPSSAVIQGSQNMGAVFTITPLMITNGSTTSISWAINGMEATAFNSQVLGGSNGMPIQIFASTIAPTATSTTTVAPTSTATQTLTSAAETSTTTTSVAPVPPTSTTTAQEKGWINISFVPALYPFVNRTAIIILSQPVAQGKELTITFWNQDPNFKLAQTSVTFTSQSTSWTAYVNFWCIGAPTGANNFMFDISLAGTASSDFQIQPGQNFASIMYKALSQITVSDIPTNLTVNWPINVTITLGSVLPEANSYIVITPVFDSKYISFEPASWVVQGNTITTGTLVLRPTAATNINGTMISFTIGGMASYAFNSAVSGGNSRPVFVWAAPSTTAVTETATSTTTATATTTQQQQSGSTTTTAATTLATGTTTTATQQTQTATQQTQTQTQTAAPTSTTVVSINPQNPPKGWLVIKRKNLTPLTDAEKQQIRNSLATFLNFPAALITVGQVDSAGDVVVVLETSSTVDQAAVTSAVKAATTFNSTQLNALGAASVDQGTLAPSTAAPADDDKLPLIVGCAVGGAVLLFIILAIVKAKTSAGTGFASAGNAASSSPGGERPLTQMEREMAQAHQHQAQHAHQHQQRGTIDNEL